MTDLRARLADALRENASEMTVGMLDCEDMADVLLSLPGIAIVELPEANRMGRWSASLQHDLWIEDGEVAQLLPKSSEMSIVLRPPHVVRGIAAALLAAAEVAEGNNE